MPCYLFSIRFLIAASVVQALPVPESLICPGIPWEIIRVHSRSFVVKNHSDI